MGSQPRRKNDGIRAVTRGKFDVVADVGPGGGPGQGVAGVWAVDGGGAVPIQYSDSDNNGEAPTIDRNACTCTHAVN